MHGARPREVYLPLAPPLGAAAEEPATAGHSSPLSCTLTTLPWCDMRLAGSLAVPYPRS